MDTTITLNINEKNITEVAESLIVNYVSTRYNRDCFGCSDIRRELRADHYLFTFFEELLIKGYNPIALFNNLNIKYNAGLRITDKSLDTSTLQTTIHSDFYLDFQISEMEWKQANNYLARERKISV